MSIPEIGEMTNSSNGEVDEGRSMLRTLRIDVSKDFDNVELAEGWRAR